jgi:hypothetical protein
MQMLERGQRRLRSHLVGGAVYGDVEVVRSSQSVPRRTGRHCQRHYKTADYKNAGTHLAAHESPSVRSLVTRIRPPHDGMLDSRSAVWTDRKRPIAVSSNLQARHTIGPLARDPAKVVSCSTAAPPRQGSTTSCTS